MSMLLDQKKEWEPEIHRESLVCSLQTGRACKRRVLDAGSAPHFRQQIAGLNLRWTGWLSRMLLETVTPPGSRNIEHQGTHLRCDL